MSVSARTSSLVPIVACNSWRSYWAKWMNEVSWLHHHVTINKSPARLPDLSRHVSRSGPQMSSVHSHSQVAGLNIDWVTQASAAPGSQPQPQARCSSSSTSFHASLWSRPWRWDLIIIFTTFCPTWKIVMSPEHITRFVWSSNRFRTNRNCTAWNI